ncbi:MAG: hypothetical protein GY864_01665 [Desulfobacterales bacterium]|nr:hypothetical protein [Desulfobacterales bacterium]
MNVVRGREQSVMCKSCHHDGGMADKNGTSTEVAIHEVYKDGEVIVVDCGSCHDVHGKAIESDGTGHVGVGTTNNLSLIRSNTSKYRTGALEDAVFQKSPEHLAFSASPYNGICQTCHTETNYHRNNDSEDHTHGSPPPPPSCTFCHGHMDGFAFAMWGKCGPPAADIDWVITTDCLLVAVNTARKNVIVESGAVLILTGNAQLYIDFDNYNLTVKQGGGVWINRGGKILDYDP